MAMTEEKAFEKWCPFARVQLENEKNGKFVGNRFTDGATPEPCNCVASECMAWRWVHSELAGQLSIGYCGLAGRPEHGH